WVRGRILVPARRPVEAPRPLPHSATELSRKRVVPGCMHEVWRRSHAITRRTPTRDAPGAATRMGVGAAPAESPPVLRGPREVCAEQGRANPNHGRGPDPIRYADAHGKPRVVDLLRRMARAIAAR